MTVTKIEIMTAMKILLCQIVLDQPILMKHLELRRHPIFLQRTTEILIQN